MDIHTHKVVVKVQRPTNYPDFAQFLLFVIHLFSGLYLLHSDQISKRQLSIQRRLKIIFSHSYRRYLKNIYIIELIIV